MAPYIASILPPHRTYVEPFCGSAAVLFAKEPSPIEVINDKDGNLVNFFRCMQDPSLSAELRHRIHYTPYARLEYEDTFHILRTPWDGSPDIRRAHAYFVYQNMVFGGVPFPQHGSPPGWGKSVGHSTGGIARATNRWLKRLTQIDAYINRLRLVQVDNRDAVTVIRDWDTSETLFYCDPPYVQSTRCGGGYRHEMTDEEHEELVETLLGAKAQVIVSGYSHPIYERLAEAGWQRLEYGTCTSMFAPQRGRLGPGEKVKQGRRTEVLWVKSHSGTVDWPLNNFGADTHEEEEGLFSGVE